MRNRLLGEGESVQKIDREKGGMNVCAGLVQIFLHSEPITTSIKGNQPAIQMSR